MGKKLYCGNLSFNVTSSDLDQMFSQYGTVQSAEVINDRDTGRSKGFGFVEMGSDAEAQAAIAGVNGIEHDGRTLTVNEARPREERRGGGGGGGGGGGRGGYGGGGGGTESSSGTDGLPPSSSWLRLPSRSRVAGYLAHRCSSGPSWSRGLKRGWDWPSGPPWNSTITGQGSPPGGASGAHRFG